MLRVVNFGSVTFSLAYAQKQLGACRISDLAAFLTHAHILPRGLVMRATVCIIPFVTRSLCFLTSFLLWRLGGTAVASFSSEIPCPPPSP